tara:strand:+ start:179 stop:502 length:324 start_codon:yes stop_codon:yes gene_type:complete
MKGEAIIPFYHLKWRSSRGHKLTWYGYVYDKMGILAALQSHGAEISKVSIEGSTVSVTCKNKSRVYVITPITVQTGDRVDNSMTEYEEDVHHAMHMAYKFAEEGEST